MKFIPLHDRIIVRPAKQSETSRGGLFIPDSGKDKPQEGEVLAVGKGHTNDHGEVFPLSVKVGDQVLFGKYAGIDIEIDEEKLLIVHEEEILGIIGKRSR